MGAPTLPTLSNSIAGSLQIPAYYHMRCRTPFTQYFFTIPSSQDDDGYFQVGRDTTPILMSYYNNTGARVWYSTDVTAVLSTSSNGGRLSCLSDGGYYGLLTGSSTNIALYKLANPYVNSGLTKLGQYALIDVANAALRSCGFQELANGNIKIIYQTDSNFLRTFVVSKLGAVVIADAAYTYGGSPISTVRVNEWNGFYETASGVIVSGCDAGGKVNVISANNNRSAISVSIPFLSQYQQFFTSSGHIRLSANWQGENPTGNGFARADFDTYIDRLAYNLGLLRP